MLTISPGSSASVGIGSSGAGSTSRPVAASLLASVCTSSMSPYCTAAAASSTVFCGGRPSITDTSPNCRSPSTSTTGVAERFAIAAATLIATQVLPTPPLVENTEIRRPGSPRAAWPGPAHAVVAPASSSPTRSTDWWRLASPPITTASRAPARSACWSTSVDSS